MPEMQHTMAGTGDDNKKQTICIENKCYMVAVYALLCQTMALAPPRPHGKHWTCGCRKRNFSHPTFSQWCFVGSQQGSGFMSWSHFKRKSSSIQFAFPPFSNETTYMWASPMIMQNRWADFCLIRFWTACLLVVNVHIFRDFTLIIETTD